ncbi:fog: zn-finger [Gigaspora margarita]|uniref:Fog: zn-finger n=1 Tax=Gigaspora margarita TaxID=4874 RepID=A0A8H4EGK2_GIGMA|nr:fog: zn-finger [Gigaspora margarita]
MSSTNKSAPSGIVTTETNERVIPASRRADGTLRKERRVRPGFVPKEDIIRYKNKFVAEREPVSSPEVEPPKTKTQKKNAKRKAKKKEDVKVIEGEELETPANEENDQEIDQLQNKMTNIKISSEENLDSLDTTVITIEQLEATAKKIKALEKKIRQIERIKEKETNGEVLLNEEKEKMSKLPQLIEELNTLKGN